MVGATGLVGREIANALSTDKRWRSVHAFGRRPAALEHLKITSHVGDLLNPAGLPAVDDVFIALGTTIRTAGSRAAFRAIDFDAVLAVAGVARKDGATRLAVVSAMGADAHSLVFYNRVKGEMEEAVAQLGFETLVIARPSLLDGDRSAMQQASRPAEQWALRAMRLIQPLVPVNYRPIAAARVAHALVEAIAVGAPGRQLMLSAALQAH